MKKLFLLSLILVAVALLGACNKQKPAKLDYSEKTNMYHPRGLPGEGAVGAPPTEKEYHGYGHEDNNKADDPEKNENQQKDKDKTDP